MSVDKNYQAMYQAEPKHLYSFAEVQPIFDKIKVLATDGNEYLLTQYFPLVLPVKNEPNLLYLDTGGEMLGCDFFLAKIEGNELLRKFDNGAWRKIATLRIPKVKRV